MKNLKNKIPFFAIFGVTILMRQTIAAQSSTQLLTLYFTDVRTGKYPAIPKPLSLPENTKKTLTDLSPYLVDTLTVVRSKAYTIIHVVGDNSRQPHIREEVVARLIQACNDKDAGNVGLVLDYLKQYRYEEYTAVSKDNVRSLFKRKIAHFDQLLKLIGFLKLTDLTDDIRPLTQPGTPQSLRWASIVALTRMGDFNAANDMMRRVKKLGVNDEIVYKIFPDLAYSRSPEAINYMIDALKSDEKNCLSADAENEQSIPCGYRIMEQLARVIENYPLTLDSSGDVKTKDYVAALKSVRDWFAKHNDFKIRQDTY